MKRRMFIVACIFFLVSVLILWAIAPLPSQNQLWLAITSLFLTKGACFLAFIIYIPEDHILISKNILNNKFMAYRRQGFFPIPPFEEIICRRSTMIVNFNQGIRNVTSSDGISHSVKCHIRGHIDFARITNMVSYSQYLNLCIHPESFIKTEIENTLRKIISEFSGEEISRGEFQARISRTFRLRLRARLDQFGCNLFSSYISTIHSDPEFGLAQLRSHSKRLEVRSCCQLFSGITKFTTISN